MRLVSYNILDGGEGRADPLAEVLLAQQADIVALIEADNDAVVERIAGRLQMQYIQAAGRRHGLAVLSKWPIVESVNHSLLRTDLSDGLLEVTVRDQTDRQWLAGALHLHPGATIDDDRLRQREIAAVCDVYAHHRAAGRPHLLAGDFNSDSPLQKIDIHACKPRTQKSWHENGGNLPRGAVEKLLAAGYADSLAQARPAEAKTTGSFTTQFPGQRVDYVFAFGFAGKIKDAWIEQDRLAKFAGDHFPVGVEVL